jgi:hypothetical protein
VGQNWPALLGQNSIALPDGGDIHYPKEIIDRQTSEPIEVFGDLRSERGGPHTGAPDHCRGRGVPACRQCGTRLVHLRYRHAGQGLDPEGHQRLLDDGFSTAHR